MMPSMETVAALTRRQVNIIRHTVMGSDQKKPAAGFYRNRFVTGEGSDDYAICNSLVDLGLMEVRRNVELFGGSDCFSLSANGLQLADSMFV